MIKKNDNGITDAAGDGFTLIEILIAMAVAAIGLFALAHLQCTAIKGNSLSSRYTQATFLAQNILERLKNGQLVNEGTFGLSKRPVSESGVVRDAGVFSGITEVGGGGGPFNVQWQVANHTEWSRLIRVTVSWNSVLGQIRYLSLVSSSFGNGN